MKLSETKRSVLLDVRFLFPFEKLSVRLILVSLTCVLDKVGENAVWKADEVHCICALER